MHVFKHEDFNLAPKMGDPYTSTGLSWCLSNKHLAYQCKRWGSIPDQGEPLEKEMAPHSNILPWKSHGQRSLVGYSPWGHKSWTQLSD